VKPEIFVNLSFDHLSNEDLDFLAIQGLHPELYFSADHIDNLTEEHRRRILGELKNRGFRPSLHAPFYDLNSGAHDSKLRAIALERLNWALDAAQAFRADQIVCHPGHGPWVLGRQFPNWLERARKTLSEVVKRAGELNLRIAFENIYDTDPADLLELLRAFPEKHVGFCFDLGHFNLFSQAAMKVWLDALGPRLFECHIHDNLGAEDDHIAIGDGNVNFCPLVQWLKIQPGLPRLTLEMEQKTHVIKSVARIREWFAPAPE